jgi:hypothetical protein
MGRLGAFLNTLLIALFVASCGGDDLDLTRSAWKSIEIEYCTPRGGTKVWSSRDAAQLEAFRAAMNPTEPTGLTMILRGSTNEIRLELASGQRWHLSYRDHPAKVTLYDPNSITRSFIVHVSDTFLATISSALTAAGGAPISLREDCQIRRYAGG